jgi:hypothetical protein
MTQEASLPPPPFGAATPSWQSTLDGPAQAMLAAPPLVERPSASAAARIIVAALAAGVLAQLLFVDQVGGINLVLWVSAVLGGAFALRPAGVRMDRADLWLPVGALTSAVFVALRHDRGLLLFDLVASGALTLASVVAIGGLAVTRRRWTRLVSLGFWAGIGAVSGALAMTPGVRRLMRLLQLRGNSVAARIIRGALLAIPLVAFFLGLFVAADAVFARVASDLISIQIGRDAMGRVLFALFVAWLFAGTMAAARLSRRRFSSTDASETTEAPVVLGDVETTVVLIALDVLFGVFVVIQAAYLFPGGDPLALTGLTYSEYARRGFFELVFAAGMAGLVILALDSLVVRRSTAYRLAAVGLVLLIGVVLISAAWRLGLYQQAYGWTDIRFYVIAAIVWLAIGAAAALFAIVRDRVSMLPKFMAAAGLGVAFACNVVGPQSFVTGQNLQRVIDPALVPPGGFDGLDAAYITRLGADGLNVLFNSLDSVPPVERADIEARLRARTDKLRATGARNGWPSWNLSKDMVFRALDARNF